MKVLLDSCVSVHLRPELESAGHDVMWVGDWPKDPGDNEILATARHEERILITLDKDFGELAIVKDSAHCGIVRIINVSLKQQAAVCLRVLELHGEELRAGAIATAEPGWVRVRPPAKDDQS